MYVIQFILFKQKQWANLCFWNSAEKGDPFIRTPLIFKSAKCFLKYFVVIYENKTKENAGTKKAGFHATEVWSDAANCPFKMVVLLQEQC